MVVVAPGNLENTEAETEISEILSLGFGNYLVFLPRNIKFQEVIRQDVLESLNRKRCKGLQAVSELESASSL